MYGGQVQALISVGTRLFAGTPSGVFISDDNAANWTTSNNGLTNYQVYFLAANAGKIYASGNSGIFVSSDNGASWSHLGDLQQATFSIAFDGSKMFATTQEGVAVSSDNGSTWTMKTQGLPNPSVDEIAIFNDKIFTNSFDGLFVSDNDGESWSLVDFPGDGFINRLLANNGKFYAFRAGKLYVSTNGSDWDELVIDIETLYVSSVAFKGTTMVAGTYDGVFLREEGEEDWTPTAYDDRSGELVVIGENIFMITTADLLMSTDNGASWNTRNEGRVTTDLRGFAKSGDRLLAASYNGVFASDDGGSTWTLSNTGLTGVVGLWLRSIAAFGNIVLVGTHQDGMFKSVDAGVTWTPIETARDAEGFAKLGDKYFAVGYSGVYVSTNQGDSWTLSNSGLSNSWPSDIIVSGEKLYIATQHGVFVSTNAGDSWNRAGTGWPDLTVARQIAISNGKIFAATGNHVYSLEGDESEWTVSNVSFQTEWVAVGATDEYIFASSFYGNDIYISKDGGLTWYESKVGADIRNSSVSSIDIIDDEVFVSTKGDGGFIRSLSDFDATPTITSFSPASGTYGDMVTITGTNFAVIPQVKFNGTPSFVQEVTPTTITVYVPDNATTGKISVSAFGSESTSATDFLVLITGLEEEEDTYVYPTIAKDFVYVKTSNITQPVTIYDGLGRTINTQQSPVNETIRVDVSPLSSGLYFLRTQETGRNAIRFLKQ